MSTRYVVDRITVSESYLLWSDSKISSKTKVCLGYHKAVTGSPLSSVLSNSILRGTFSIGLHVFFFGNI